MLTKKERREKVLIVREDWILDIALFGFPATDMLQVLNVPGLPDDWEVVRCVHEPLYSRFAVVLSHPTFEDGLQAEQRQRSGATAPRRTGSTAVRERNARPRSHRAGRGR